VPYTPGNSCLPAAHARAQYEQRILTLLCYASRVPYADKIALSRRNKRGHPNLHFVEIHRGTSVAASCLHQNSGPVVGATT
jgi:hypothetical protein